MLNDEMKTAGAESEAMRGPVSDQGQAGMSTDSAVKVVDFTAEPVGCSVKPIRFDESLCIGCGSCAAVCQVDILLPPAEGKGHPIVMYPGECYYCGSCVMACPVEGAIKLQHPLMNQTKFVEVVEA